MDWARLAILPVHSQQVMGRPPRIDDTVTLVVDGAISALPGHTISSEPHLSRGKEMVIEVPLWVVRHFGFGSRLPAHFT